MKIYVHEHEHNSPNLLPQNNQKACIPYIPLHPFIRPQDEGYLAAQVAIT